MIAIDTNVLVHARREEMPKHIDARNLLFDLAERDEPWGLPVFCIGEFLRVVTHPRIFSLPTSLEDALQGIHILLSSPSAQLLTPGAGYWPILRQVLLQSGITGNGVFDAQIAALCIEHNVEALITEDRDFRRFDNLQTRSI